MRRPEITNPLERDATRSRAADIGVLALRVGVGGLMAAHGAQKLFGSFDGPGLSGMAGWLESMGLKPGKAWAGLAGASEFGGGALTALGLGGPVGPIAMQGAMATAARQAHWQLPVFAASGGPEVPVLYSVAGAALALTGPGRYSLDRALGVRVPLSVALATGVGVAAGVALAESMTAKAKAAQPAGDADAAESGTTAGEAGGEDALVDESVGASDTSVEDGASHADDIAVTPSADEATGAVVI